MIRTHWSGLKQRYPEVVVPTQRPRLSVLAGMSKLYHPGHLLVNVM